MLEMFNLAQMGKEILDAIKAVGADANRANWQALINVLDLHATTADDVYLRRGLEHISNALKAHGDL